MQAGAPIDWNQPLINQSAAKAAKPGLKPNHKLISAVPKRPTLR